MSISLPTLSRIFSVRNLMRALFAVLTLITVFAIFRVVERWRGERVWKQYREAAVARGVKLNLKDVVPPDVPDAENFASTPLVQEVFKPVLKAGSFPGYYDGVISGSFYHRVPRDGKDKLLLDIWRDELVGKKVVPPGTDSVDAAFAGLKLMETPLNELREAAKRPKSKFPLAWENGVQTQTPHIFMLMITGCLHRLGMAANLARGDTRAALNHFHDGLRMYEVQVEEPALTLGVARLTTLAVVRDGVYQEGALMKWNDGQLKEISDALSEIDLIKDWRIGIGGERAVLNDAVDNLCRMSAGDLCDQWDDVTIPHVDRSKSWMDKVDRNALLTQIACMLYPRGWFRLSQVRMNQDFDRFEAGLDAFEKSGRRNWAAIPKIQPPRTETFSDAPYLLHRVLWSYLGRYQYTRAIVDRDQTVLACALARYRLKTGEFPETLEALVPEFIQEIPQDPIDGRQMRYRRTPDGGFALWSIGDNRSDEGGQGRVGRVVSGYERDWVLQVPGEP